MNLLLLGNFVHFHVVMVIVSFFGLLIGILSYNCPYGF